MSSGKGPAARTTVSELRENMTMEKLKDFLKTSDRRFFRILAIDGGGIRGVLPGMVVCKLEALLQEATGNPNARVGEFFDLIAGTSTGGILSCVYLCPGDKDESGKVRPKYSAQDAVDLYLKNGGEIFTRTLGRRIRTIGGVIGAKYSAKPIEKYLNQYLGDVKLSDIQKLDNFADCLITNFDMTEGKPSFLTSFDVGRAKISGKGLVPDFYMKDVARSTSAAPTYFPPAWVAPIDSNEKRARVDGGTFANNPTLAALVEALKMDHDTKGEEVSIRNISILSIGTKGGTSKGYSYNKIKGWGVAQWVQPVINVMMSGVSETTDFQAQKVYELIPSFSEFRGQYLRIEPSRGKASGDMDNASASNLQLLKAAGAEAGEKSENALIHAMKYLLSGRQDEFPKAFEG